MNVRRRVANLAVIYAASTALSSCLTTEKQDSPAHPDDGLYLNNPALQSQREGFQCHAGGDVPERRDSPVRDGDKMFRSHSQISYYFDHNSDKSRTSGLGMTKEVARFGDVRGIGYMMVGCTDSNGTDAYNRELSTRRIEDIAQSYIERGVHPLRICAMPMGEQCVGDSEGYKRRVDVIPYNLDLSDKHLDN